MTVARGATAVPLGKLIIIPHGNTVPIWPTVIVGGKLVVLNFRLLICDVMQCKIFCRLVRGLVRNFERIINTVNITGKIQFGTSLQN